MALKLQYKHSHQRSKTLPMPIELLVDIFRSLNTTKEIAPSFTSDNFNATSNKNKYVRLRNFNRLKIWWELQVEDLLTSSAIIYIVARNAFLNRKKSLVMESIVSSRDDNEFTLDGESVIATNKFNIDIETLKFIDCERRLLVKDSPIYLAKEEIIKFFSTYKNEENKQIFNVYSTGKEKRIVLVYDHFDKILIPRLDEKKFFYVNENFCLRAHILGDIFHLMQNFHSNFIVFGDLYNKLAGDEFYLPCRHVVGVVRILSEDKKPNEWPVTPANYFSERNSLFTRLPDDLPFSLKNFNTFDMMVKVDDFWNSLGINSQYQFVYNETFFAERARALTLKYKDRMIKLFTCGQIREDILNKAGRKGCVGWGLFIQLDEIALIKNGLDDLRSFWPKLKNFEKFVH